MRIKLSDGWFIEDEVHGYAVYQETINKKGDVAIINNTYPISLERCVDFMVRTNMNTNITTDISFVEYIKTMRAEFTKFMDEINKYIKGE